MTVPAANASKFHLFCEVRVTNECYQILWRFLITLMWKFEKNIYTEDTSCRLCHSNLNTGDIIVIDEIIEQVLDILLLKLNGTKEHKSMMCKACSTKLFAAFNFKATCTDTEDCIFPYIDSEMEAPADLTEIYLKVKGKEHLKHILEDERICRLCMQVSTCGFTSVNEVDVDPLLIYIPEVDFSSVREPVICKVCLDLLDTHVSFLGNFFNAEEEIENVSCDKAIKSSPHIITDEIELKSEDYNDSPWEDEPVDYTSDCQSEYAGSTNNSKHNTQKEPTRTVGKKFRLKHKDSSKARAYKRDPDYENSQKGDIVPHKDVTGKRVWKCDLCNYIAIFKYNLRQHHLKHKVIPDEQMLKCDSCDYKTRRKRYLVRHQLRHKSDSEQRMLKCDSCSYKTIYKCYLKNHQLKHKVVPDEQMLKCDSCDYKTRRKRYLIRHQLIHKRISEEQMLKCDSCDYKTRQKRYLISHQLRHKSVSEEQMLKCDLCSYKTIYKFDLIRHQLKHKDISEGEMLTCDSCDFKTRQKRYLRRHQLIHRRISEDQVLKCDSCDYKTRQKRYLTRHQLKHKDISEGEMFTCDSCNYKTRQKKYLRNHQQGQRHLRRADVKM